MCVYVLYCKYEGVAADSRAFGIHAAPVKIDFVKSGLFVCGEMTNVSTSQLSIRVWSIGYYYS